MLSKMRATDREKIALGMSVSYAELALRAVPPGPEKGKWTKTAPAYDFIMALDLVCGLAVDMLKLAKQKLKIKTVAFDGDWSGLSYGQSESARLDYTLGLLANDGHMLKVRLGILIFIGTRYMHTLFFKASRELQSPVKPNLLLDYLNPVYSHATVAVQFLSSLASGQGPLLKMLWHRHGRMDRWVDDEPVQASHSRSTIYFAVGSLHRRHIAIQ